jgi:cytochrome P450
MDAGPQPRLPAACPHFDPHAADPHPMYATLRRDAPVFHDPQLGIWVVSRHADIVAATKQPEVFSSRGSLTAAGEFPRLVQSVLANGVEMVPPLTEMDRPGHTRIRSVFNRAFTPRNIEEMAPGIRAIADELIGQFEGDGKADLVSQFASPLAGFVICDLLGVPRTDFPKLKEWNEDWLALLSIDLPEDDQIRCAHGVLDYQRYLHGQFLDRQQNPGEDLISVMLPSGMGGTAAMTLSEGIYNVIDSIAGAYMATEQMITNTVAVLFENRDQYDRISADPTLIDQAIEEILRFATSVQGIFRVTTRPVELGDVTLPADARVFLLYASANRDGQHISDPDILNIDRPLTRDHMTFGRGIHACIGQALARLMIRISLESLQKRLPNLRPATDTTQSATRHVLLHGYGNLPVTWGAPAFLEGETSGKDAIRAGHPRPSAAG